MFRKMGAGGKWPKTQMETEEEPRMENGVPRAEAGRLEELGRG